MTEAQIVDFGIAGLKADAFYAGNSDSKEKINAFMKDKIVYFVLMNQMVLWIFYVEDEERK